MVITLDSESNNPSSSLGMAFLRFKVIFLKELVNRKFDLEPDVSKNREALPRIELGLLDSKSSVLIITP